MSREERQCVAEELVSTLQEVFHSWHRAVGRVEGVTQQIINSFGYKDNMSREERQCVAEELVSTLQEVFHSWHRAVGRVEGVTQQIINSFGCTEEEDADVPVSPVLFSLTCRRRDYCTSAYAVITRIKNALTTLQSLLKEECNNYKTFLSRIKHKAGAVPVPSTGSSAAESVDMDEYLDRTPASRVSRITLLDKCVETLESLVVEYEILLYMLKTATFSKDTDDFHKDQLKDSNGSESQIIYDLREYIQHLSRNSQDKNSSRDPL
ncbi:hypothetical protein FHG87_001244 [Trinorchestia longiramus]|nr:hypothetical protein FHG87_001244 [Trinorchestia longiramus]